MAKTASPSAKWGVLELFPWEKATLTPAELTKGWLKPQHLTSATLLFTAALLALLVPTAGVPAALLAFPLGRLMALDLTTHTLPDVYTLPLLAAGLTHAALAGQGGTALLTALLLLAIAEILHRTPLKISGGDAKLLAALFVWLGPVPGCFAVAVGCVAWFPFAFAKPKSAQPFGVPLALGWALALAFL